MTELIEKSSWIQNKSWQKKILLFFFLREKAKDKPSQEGHFSYDNKNREKAESIHSGVYRWISNAEASWNDNRDLITQEEWVSLQAWLKAHPLHTIDIDDWKEGNPTPHQILGFEIKTFLSHFEIKDIPDMSNFTDEDGIFDANAFNDAKNQFKSLFETYLKDIRYLILEFSTAYAFWDHLWEIWTIELQEYTECQIELFFRVVDKEKISNIYLANPTINVFLKAIDLLKKSSKKYNLCIYGSQNYLKQIIFITKHLGLKKLSCLLQEKEECLHTGKKALWASFSLERVNHISIKEIVNRINQYDLVCQYCERGTGIIDQRLREALVSKTGLQWVISNFPRYYDVGSSPWSARNIYATLEVAWRKHQNLDQWMFFNKSYDQPMINFYNFTPYNSGSIIEEESCLNPEFFEFLQSKSNIEIEKEALQFPGLLELWDNPTFNVDSFDSEGWEGASSDNVDWRFLTISKKYILKDESVLKQYYWQAEADREFSVRSIDMGQYATIQIYDKDQDCHPKEGAHLPVITSQALRTDYWGIDFSKATHFVDSSDVNQDRVIDEPVVLGFIGHRGFPIWFEYFDPYQSPYEKIYIPDEICLIKPKEGVSAQALWDTLIYSISRAMHDNLGNFQENWWVITELKNKKRWAKEIARLEVEDEQYLYAGQRKGGMLALDCNRWFTNFEKRTDWIALFLQNIKIQLNRDVTFQSLLSVLEERLGGGIGHGEDSKISLGYTFDQEQLVAINNHFKKSHSRSNYLIVDLDNVYLLIWDQDRIVGLVSIQAMHIGLRLYDILNYVELTTFVYKSWKNIQAATLEESASLIAHEVQNVYLIMKKRIERLQKKLSDDNEAQEDAQEALHSLDKLNDFAAQLFSYREVIDDINAVKIELRETINSLFKDQSVSISGKANINFYKLPIEMIIKNFANNAIKYSSDQHCDISIENRFVGSVQIVFSNKTKANFNQDILTHFGQKPFKGKEGGRGAFFVCRMIDRLGGSWQAFYEEGKFIVKVILEEG